MLNNPNKNGSSVKEPEVKTVEMKFDLGWLKRLSVGFPVLLTILILIVIAQWLILAILAYSFNQLGII